jgi:hypothetical protein
MAIRLRLGSYEPVEADPLGRPCVGYFPRMTEQEAWEAGRGPWRIDADKVARQRFALIIGEGLVRAIAEITGTTALEDRLALTGTPLPIGHPVRDAWLGQPDPIVNSSQHPIGYCDLAEERPYVYRPCGCGCAQETDRDFLPGHEIRAIQNRIRRHFDGSALRLIQWIDDTAPPPDPATDDAPNNAHQHDTAQTPTDTTPQEDTPQAADQTRATTPG